MTHQRIFAKISRDEFVGRDAELREIVGQASTDRHGLIVLAAPGVGAAELLRQAYDQLFVRRGDPVPVHFAFKSTEETLPDVARRFFQNLLQQYVAYRRVDTSLCNAQLSFHDLLEIAPPGDYELLSDLIEGFERERTGGDQRDFVRFCLNAPHRLSTAGRRVSYLIDCTQLALRSEDAVILGQEITAAVSRANGPFTVAGVRRQVVDLIQGSDEGHDAFDLLHLERLSDNDAHRLVEMSARRNQVETNEPTRDLIVQQMNASPFFIHSLIRAARDAKTPLTSFVNCQRLYVDELLGGHVHRHFNRILEAATPNPQTKKSLLKMLFESTTGDAHKSSLWAWKKRLGVDAAEFERIVDALHIHELVNSSAAFIEVNTDSYLWTDYLRAHYRLEVAGEGRALVVATTLLDSLKRAPHAMARKYRHEAALGLRDLISDFNCQQVPAGLFHYERFASVHKGEDTETVNAALDAESDLIRLPQIVHAAGCNAYSTSIPCDGQRCAVAHGFEAADYTDESEVVWLAAEIDSKLEASRELTAEWCDRLANLARESGFERVRLWLVAPEGFSPEASELLNSREAYGSSRQQVELLTARIASAGEAEEEQGQPNEYEMVIPMGADTELIAAHTVEQIARRLNFGPEAINQIKTALIEACINAAEHSLSPDRKIYQRFRVDKDKLVVTVASRGVVPASLAGRNGQQAEAKDENEDGRRGWGLKLIQTLMDEVEFERVDDGTQLRMTKYFRK
ncbi:MAG: serine/threonine-protein kinase RsbW [Blastocatellia bacterium]|jgi:serine/threonine-protein kinase RsbW|nr:serine/threonine-protein kinase RsbW [Blastocatellia bacterium]